MGTPFSNITYNTILDSVWTQGALGSDYSGGAPSVYTWDEVSQEFKTVPNLDVVPEQGAGFIAYLYEDNDPSTSSIDGGWPKEFQTTGIAGFGGITIPVTYNNGTNPSLDGYNLIANPYPFTIVWDASSGWSKTNIQDALWVWDPTANNGVGNYLVYSNGVGDPISEIAPFQAFWVRSTSSNPSLEVNEDIAASSSAAFLKEKSQPPFFLISASINTLKDNIYFSFQKDLSSQPDDGSVAELPPLANQFLTFYSKSKERKLAIQNLSKESPRLEIPLVLESSSIGPVTLTFKNLKSLQENYMFELLDNDTQLIKILEDSVEFNFDLHSDKKSFTLLISKREIVSTETDDTLPLEVSLYQNYPNPFNPSTTIAFNIHKSSRVNLGVFDIQGRKITILVDGVVSAGLHSVPFNSAQLSSGVYIYRLITDEEVLTKKLTILK